VPVVEVASRMKPAAVVVVLSLSILLGGAPATADSPGQLAEPLPSPFENTEPGHWSGPWLARPPIVAEGADLWLDYRGACIEHDLYRPRFLARPSEEHQRRPLLSAIGNWLDGLFAWTPPHEHQHGQFCDANDHAVEDSGFVPTPSPTAPSPAVDPRSPRPAPFLAPVPLGEIDPPSGKHAPSAPVPVQVIPAEPTPAAPTVRPPANEIPKLTAPRGPIVELVPEPAISAAEPPSPLIVPRNRVPRPGDPLPRNSIPQ
jgi:hypothetical protein